MNKYNLWYSNIVDRARCRKIDGYAEKHHVVPQSLGGSNDKDNLVDLTAREHFICHWLLTKIYTGEAKAKMIYALNGMKRSNEFAQRYETKITARVYENLKKQFSMVHSATMKGRTPWNKGLTKDDPRVAKYALAPKWNKGKTNIYSDETLSKMSAARIGKPTTKGRSNPQAVINGKKGAAKLSAKVTGRKKKVLPDGTWTWEYPNK